MAFARDKAKFWVVEVPLLFEKSLQNWFDFTVCIASDPTVQLARLEQRGIPPLLARQRISKQLPLTQKIKLVDFVLLNDGSPDFLRDQVTALVSSLSTL
jgi:dephospho-CoA kinase